MGIKAVWRISEEEEICAGYKDVVGNLLLGQYGSQTTGKESCKDGQPHYHYISDKFGMPRDKVLAELKSRDYSLGLLPHIDLLDYGDQPIGPA